MRHAFEYVICLTNEPNKTFRVLWCVAARTMTVVPSFSVLQCVSLSCGATLEPLTECVPGPQACGQLLLFSVHVSLCCGMSWCVREVASSVGPRDCVGVCVNTRVYTRRAGVFANSFTHRLTKSAFWFCVYRRDKSLLLYVYVCISVSVSIRKSRIYTLQSWALCMKIDQKNIYWIEQ